MKKRALLFSSAITLCISVLSIIKFKKTEKNSINTKPKIKEIDLETHFIPFGAVAGASIGRTERNNKF